MKKNYYEILEVDKRASEEILDKAYKTLAKKYHPDLQNGMTIAGYEEKMKLINEAYAVLSDRQRRAKYDEQLRSEEILEENIEIKQETNNIANNIYQNINKQIEKRYGPRKPYSPKKRMKILGIMVAVILFVTLIGQIPFIHDLYGKNAVLKAIIDPFVNTFKQIFHL